MIADGAGRRKGWLIAVCVLGLIAILCGVGALYYRHGDWPVYARARAERLGGARAARLYRLIGRRYPALEPYAELWAAEAILPDAEAVRALHDLCAYQPDGPVAYAAHVALARYYAGIESPETIDEYAAALQIDDRSDIRLELAWYLEEQNAPSLAYAHYLYLLGAGRDDAFVGARRTAPDVITLANDLLELGYLNDVVDVLYGVDDCQAYCLSGRALQRLGQQSDAEALLSMCALCGGAEEAESSTDADEAADEPATPLELWNETWTLEEAQDYAALLPLYLELAETDSIYADDAAYRVVVLARRLNDASAEQKGLALLSAMQPNWLAARENGRVDYCVQRDYPAQAVDELVAPVMARVDALETLELDELAHQELRLTALVSETPEVIQRMAQELTARGYTTESWSLGAVYLRRDDCAPLTMWELAYPRPYAEIVQAAAEENDLDAALLWAVMKQESAYQPEIVSWAGARGLMQIMPFTQDEYCGQGEVPCAPGASFDPAYNIEMGAAHLRQYIDYYEGDVELAVLAYNAGPGNVDQWLADPAVTDHDDLLRLAWFGETREYLERVMLDRAIYQALYPAD